ncbi:MAG: Ribonuclease Y [Mycoplasmataceae bacterium]|nr:MAG: Ribonuclease Y [Mycoplasmataceae bacterium]
MNYTKKTSRNLLNKKNYFSWIYIFFIFASIILIGLAVYWWPKNSLQAELNLDCIKQLRNWKDNPTKEEVNNLLSAVRDIQKATKWSLSNEKKRKKLTNKKKQSIQNQLGLISEKISQILEGVDLNNATSLVLKNLYSQLYEQGKLLVKLKRKVIKKTPYDELKKQYFYNQPEWKITELEEKEIQLEMDKWIKEWYRRFVEEKLRPEQNEKILTEYIKPITIDGQKVTKISSNEVARFRKKLDYQELKNGISNDGIIDLRNPLWIKFNGYGGFLNEQEKQSSCENSSILGITLSSEPITLRSEKDEFKCFFQNTRSITIKLLKEMFFNRLGYEFWISDLNEEENTTIDISFDQVVENIAHELAHAVVNSVYGEYFGEYDGKGGHGKVHDDFTERIEKMIRKSNDFSKFKSWWEKKKNDN